MRSIIFISLLLFTVACNQSVKKLKILPYEALHGNSSKVWIIEQQIYDGENVTPKNRDEKIVMTLYNDQTFIVHLITEFAFFSDNNGIFSLSDDGKFITFTWAEDTYATYKLLQASEYKLIYETTLEEEVQQKITFIPIDKPYYQRESKTPEVIELFGEIESDTIEAEQNEIISVESN